VSGTSAAAATVAAAAAVLAEGRPQASAADLRGLLVGSARATSSDTPSGSGQLDLAAAAQQEITTEPATLAFGTAGTSRPTLESTLTVHNVSTRALTVRVEPGGTRGGIEVTASKASLELLAASSATVVLRADTSDLSDDARAVTGVILLRSENSRPVRVPWAVAAPDPKVDLLSNVSLKTTSGRVSDATPAVLSVVVGGVVPGPMPEVRPVDMLQVQLWRNAKLLGVLAKRRELLPGRYTFGLTGRGPDGARLRGREYTVRLVARPSDGTRRQVETVDYLLR
jgi:hypothetical protein